MDFSPGRSSLGAPSRDGHVYVQIRRTLPRLLAFAGWSIDDVVSNPIAKRDMLRWYKTERRMQRMIEVADLERQWNPAR